MTSITAHVLLSTVFPCVLSPQASVHRNLPKVLCSHLLPRGGEKGEGVRRRARAEGMILLEGNIGARYDSMSSRLQEV